MLMGVYGDVGSGKTLLGVRFAKFTDVHTPIRCNFKLDLPNATSIEPYELVALEDGTLVAIDEFYTWAESRISPSKLNRFISYFLAFQSRKRKLHIMHFAQLRGSIDIRFRLMEQYTILAKTRENLDSDDFHYKIKMSNHQQVKSFSFSYNSMKSLFPIYHTEELILPLDIKELQADMLFFNPMKLNSEVDKIAQRIREAGFINEKVTHDSVKDMMLRIGEPFNLEPYVYVRLKSLEND